MRWLGVALVVLALVCVGRYQVAAVCAWVARWAGWVVQAALDEWKRSRHHSQARRGQW